jgi:hypothetical protein
VREREIEEHLRDQVRAAGGRAYKWVSPGNNGVPDRIVMLPGGRVAFVELKAPGNKPTKLQLAQHRTITKMGLPVAVVDSKEGVADLIQRMQTEGGIPPWPSQQ